MKLTDYKGLDYGHGQSNIDKSTGIRFGVISCNSIMGEAQNDFDPDYGRPTDTECPECGNHVPVDSTARWGDTTTCPECGEDFSLELPDMVEPSGWSYEKDGYALCDCLDNDCLIAKSPYYTFAQFCSPCVPGAGNLDNPAAPDPVLEMSLKAGQILYRRACEKEGWPKVYCLGMDWFDEYNPCPYPAIFRVDNNEPVLP